MATQVSSSVVSTASTTNTYGMQQSPVRRYTSTQGLTQAVLDFIAVMGTGLQVAASGQADGEVLSLITALNALVFILLAQQAGLYSKHRDLTHKLSTLSRIWLCTMGTVSLLCIVLGQAKTLAPTPFIAMNTAALLLQLGFHTFHHFSQRTRVSQSSDVERALIIGQGGTADYLHQKIADNPWLEQKVVTRTSFHYLENCEASGSDQRCNPELITDRIERLIDIEMITVVYLVAPTCASKCFEAVYKKLLDRQVAIHWVPDILALDLVNHSMAQLAGLPMVRLSETPPTAIRLLTKAIEDKLLGGLILLAASPIMLIIAAAIWLESPGGVLCSHPSYSWNLGTFRSWKFRTMQRCVSDRVPVGQMANNERQSTRIGAFLRRTNLDRLPQLINVITGEMSLVGPLPCATVGNTEHFKRISTYMARHHIKPGMTGLAQVRGYRGETTSLKDMQQRIESDLEYINQWSLGLDLSILIRTFGVFKSDKAY